MLQRCVRQRSIRFWGHRRHNSLYRPLLTRCHNLHIPSLCLSPLHLPCPRHHCFLHTIGCASMFRRECISLSSLWMELIRYCIRIRYARWCPLRPWTVDLPSVYSCSRTTKGTGTTDWTRRSVRSNSCLSLRLSAKTVLRQYRHKKLNYTYYLSAEIVRTSHVCCSWTPLYKRQPLSHRSVRRLLQTLNPLSVRRPIPAQGLLEIRKWHFLKTLTCTAENRSCSARDKISAKSLGSFFFSIFSAFLSSLIKETEWILPQPKAILRKAHTLSCSTTPLLDLTNRPVSSSLPLAVPMSMMVIREVPRAVVWAAAEDLVLHRLVSACCGVLYEGWVRAPPHVSGCPCLLGPTTNWARLPTLCAERLLQSPW